MKKPAVEEADLEVDPAQAMGEGEVVGCCDGKVVADVEDVVRIDLVRTTVPQSR